MILVTGGTGFVGAYIIRELVMREYAVRAIRRRDYQPFFIDDTIWHKVEWVECDILDPVGLFDAMQGVELVIHAAAMVSFHKSERELLYQTNVTGTANVVNMAIESGIERFIHISSVAALGRTANNEIVNEEKKWQEGIRQTHYAISKYQAELEVWRGMGEGMQITILNPSTVLGFGDWNNSSCGIFKNVYNEFPWYSNGVNGFVDVEDLARACVLLMEKKIYQERFIINGDNWSFRRLFDTMAEALHKKKPSREAGPMLGALAWRWEKLSSLFTGKKPLLTRETARIAQSNTQFDHQKLLQALPGFQFTSLETSIRNAAAKYLDHYGRNS